MEVRQVVGGPRSGVLELAVLGLLHDTPMHGYELRKRLNALLGAFRAFGYGSLYPCLKDLLAQGLIAEEQPSVAGPPLAGRRSKIVYRLTAEGKERLQQLLAEPGPAAWEDDGFGVRFAFFGQTRADIRLRILEGRRTRLEERLDGVRAAMARTRERLDSYTLELHRHGLESVEREVRWLNELIASERESGASERGWAPSGGGRSVGAGAERGGGESRARGREEQSAGAGTAERRLGGEPSRHTAPHEAAQQQAEHQGAVPREAAAPPGHGTSADDSAS